MENGDKRRPRRTFLQMVRDFCDYTSVHGLGRAVGTKFSVFRVLWVILFMAAIGMATFQLIPLFYKYQSRPISTRISLKSNSVSHR